MTSTSPSTASTGVTADNVRKLINETNHDDCRAYNLLNAINPTSPQAYIIGTAMTDVIAAITAYEHRRRLTTDRQELNKHKTAAQRHEQPRDRIEALIEAVICLDACQERSTRDEVNREFGNFRGQLEREVMDYYQHLCNRAEHDTQAYAELRDLVTGTGSFFGRLYPVRKIKLARPGNWNDLVAIHVEAPSTISFVGELFRDSHPGTARRLAAQVLNGPDDQANLTLAVRLLAAVNDRRYGPGGRAGEIRAEIGSPALLEIERLAQRLRTARRLELQLDSPRDVVASAPVGARPYPGPATTESPA